MGDSLFAAAWKVLWFQMFGEYKIFRLAIIVLLPIYGLIAWVIIHFVRKHW
jgi:hypothetical protein